MIISVRDKVHKQMQYPSAFRVRVGVGGGIGCPQSVVAAFSMGGLYFLLLSFNILVNFIIFSYIIIYSLVFMLQGFSQSVVAAVSIGTFLLVFDVLR
jgi:hypothetical protein